MPILLDTGSSGPNGWSSISRFLRCPELFFWTERVEEEEKPLPLEAPLVRGSIGHAGLAHLYERARLTQRGEGFGHLLSPTEAMAAVAESFGVLGESQLPVALPVVEAYARRHALERLEIVGVERLATTEFGGHPYTARIDLEYRDNGKVFFLDHKFVSRIAGKIHRRYTLSGQILGLWHLGAREYGSSFGGVVLNLLGVKPIDFSRSTPEPAPWMLTRFPEIVARAHEGIARERAAMREPGYVVQATPSEYTCWPYNRPCPAFESCRWGWPKGGAVP